MTSGTDVLIVGAGPTGLALALDLKSRGVDCRVIDRAADAVHESRALAIQARTLEVLSGSGIAAELVARGDPATTLLMHFGRGTTELPLFEAGIDETAYPFLLFLSQAETERILLIEAGKCGIVVERGSELLSVAQTGEGVVAVTRTPDGRREIEARYLVGCDGAHSAVRRTSGIGFSGEAFPQTFLIADLEAAGPEPDRLHAFIAREGMMFFFPLGSPATWRLLVMVPPDERHTEPTLAAAQSIVDRYTPDPIRLHDPVWITNFSVQSRRADRFRDRRVMLAGDAAHIHSPAGAQGMNTGIQDAVNLGWKLAMVCDGASEMLLDTYDVERLPVADRVLRLTNRAFRIATSANPVVRSLRPRAAALALPLLMRSTALRRTAFRVVSELGVSYRRSPLSVEGRPRLGGGPRSGDRLPDAPIMIDGAAGTIHAGLPPGRFHALLCGGDDGWDGLDDVERWPLPVSFSRMDAVGGPGIWTASREALRRLGLRERDTAQFLVRPDGYIGYRARGTDLSGMRAYLSDLARQ